MNESTGATAPRRTRKPAEERRSEILRAAATVFSDYGYRLADCQEVANRAGVGKGTIYRHFDTKEALFIGCLRHGLDQLRERVEAAASEVSDPLDKLRAAFRAYFAFFDEQPQVVELFILERAELRQRGASMYFSYSEADRAVWLPVIQALMDAGRLRAADPDLVLDTLGVLAFGSVVSDRLSVGEQSLGQRADQLFDIFQHGVLSPRENRE